MQQTVALLLIDLQQGLDITWHEKCSTSYKDTGASPTKNVIFLQQQAVSCLPVCDLQGTQTIDRISSKRSQTELFVWVAPVSFYWLPSVFFFRIREISRWVIIQLIPKTIGNRKRDCAWGCAWGINTTWENLQIEKHKSVRFGGTNAFLICAFRFADFLRWCLFPKRNLTHNLFFYFQ